MNELPKARPICLLNEIAKAFERIIANRIFDWLLENPDSDFSPNQFEFRKGLSTCDALSKFKEITSSIVERGGYAIAVSLDIKNAFNSMPWKVVRRALEIKSFPLYIRKES